MPLSGLWRTGALLLLGLTGSIAQAAPDIAILLPQSGRLAKAGDAIRNGFLAAYYQDSSNRAESPTLHFYDSDAVPILPLVRQVAADGATMIIGPLDREHLEPLIKAGTLPVPVLALNSADGQAENLFEFALAPEDEILRLIEWLEKQNIRHPLLLTAADEASQRQVKIFQSFWMARHAEEPAVSTLDPTRKGGVAVAIRELVRFGGKSDALFLATPTLARQVQPALTYYHSTLPLFSLASAWDPTVDASGQKDLDGMKFCDLPWMLGETRPEQQALYDAFPRPASGYDRLYAFGADVWTLTRQWRSLQEGKPMPMRSGLIQMDATHYLHRTPTCAEIRNGTAFPLWSPEFGPRATGSGS